MTTLANALACVFALGCASFLWKSPSFIKNAVLVVGSLLLFCLFAYFAAENFAMAYASGVPQDSGSPQELYPFRMMALCLCFSTTSLPKYRRRYLVLAQALWCWIELFGGISLYYRGVDFAWTRVVALFAMSFCSTLLSKISREMEFCLMVFWIAIWIFLV